MKISRRITSFISALAISAMLTFGASAQGIVGDVIDGAENTVDDTIDTAEDILGGEDDTIGSSSDIPDQIGDDTDPNSGKDENSINGPATNEADPNPNTGIGVPFMTAGLVAVSAAGVAYLTRRRSEIKSK